MKQNSASGVYSELARIEDLRRQQLRKLGRQIKATQVGLPSGPAHPVRKFPQRRAATR